MTETVIQHDRSCPVAWGNDEETCTESGCKPVRLGGFLAQTSKDASTMTPIDPTTLPADECQRLIADLIPTLTQGKSVMGDRILALAPKPGPWPLDLGGGGDSFAILDGNGNLRLTFADQEVPVLAHRMDALAVQWLQHRGVDLLYVRAALSGSGLSPVENPSTLEALRRILANAKEQSP